MRPVRRLVGLFPVLGALAAALVILLGGSGDGGEDPPYESRHKHGGDRVWRPGPTGPASYPPGSAKLALHATALPTKNRCQPSWFTSTSCRDFVTSVGTGGYAVYVLVVGAEEGIAGAAFGIEIGSSILVLDWSRCTTLEFRTGDWPGSGSGNVLTYDRFTACQTTRVTGFESEGRRALLGWFYMYAYGPSLFRLTPHPAHGQAQVADCLAEVTAVDAGGLAALGFDLAGHNPCPSCMRYRDLDGDTFGDPAQSIVDCGSPPGYVENNLDCDDTNAAVHPGAAEACNGVDDDCDGQTDEGVLVTFYRDFDADTYGDPTATALACAPPVGYVANDLDCDDTNAAVHPGAAEACNGIDDDCDGQTDETCSVFEIVSIKDVGNDQGRRVRVRWAPHPWDEAGSPVVISSYSLYRRIVPGLVPAGPAESGTAETPPGEWDFVLNIPATGDALYSTLAETLCDSTTLGICWSTFFVRAHTPQPLLHFDTAPEVGYSVDNLAPGVPQGLLVQHLAAATTLAWDENRDPDLSHYRIYRGATPDFEPGPGNLVQTTAAESWTDVHDPGAQFHYRVSAVDFSGNESPAASPFSVTGTDAPAPTAGPRLLLPGPNPARSFTNVQVCIPEGGANILLEIFDARGRKVAMLADGFAEGGVRDYSWDATQASGTPLPSGVYYVRFVCHGSVFGDRITLIR